MGSAKLYNCIIVTALGLAVGCWRTSPATFDVSDYGAVADGTTDSQPAIQEAVDKAAAAGGGRVVLPPSKTPYLIRSTIEITASDIEFAGPGATIELADGVSNSRRVHVIFVHGTPEQTVRNVNIRGLTVDANYFHQLKANRPLGIIYEYAEHVLVQDVSIRRPYVGLGFKRGVRDAEARQVTITDFEEDGFDASGDGEELPGSTTVNVRFVNDTAKDAPRSRGNAFEIEDGVHGVLVSDSTVANISGDGFGIRNHWNEKNVSHSDNVEVRNVTIRNVRGDYGIYSRCAPPDRFPSISFHNVRLINVTVDAPVFLFGPMRGLKIEGGRYGSVYLGYQPAAQATSDPQLAVADATLRDLSAGYIQINGAGGHILLDNVSVERGTNGS